MPTIRVKGLDRSLEAGADANLRKACIEGNVNLFWGPWAKALNCRGKGFCNLCKVEVLEGVENLTPPTKRETKRMKNKPDHWRLACCTKVQGDVTIDPFPVRHPTKEVSPEAIRRALLDEEERKALEKDDWGELREAQRPEKKEKGPKKGILAKIRKTKGIDDSDAAPEPGEGVRESEDGSEAAGKPKKGLLAKRAKKEKPAKKEKAAKGKPPKKGGKKIKPGPKK